MNIKFKDVSHHYLGCGVVDSITGDRYLIHSVNMEFSVSNPENRVKSSPILLQKEDMAITIRMSDTHKPMLRPLSDILDIEKKEVYKLIFKREFPKTGQIIWRSDKSLTSEQRWILLTGVDRVGIEMNGTVWADCDLHNYKHNQHIITSYLLSMRFDLFGLIESGEAAKFTIKTPQSGEAEAG
jgi:hypothetical protein